MIGAKMKHSHPSFLVNETSNFIAEYAAWLYGCGATCTRIKKNVERIAKKWNINCQLLIMPGSVQLMVFDPSTNQSSVVIRRTPHTGISFYKNTHLSQLSWRIADGLVDLDEANKILKEVSTAPFTNKWLVLLLTSLANLSFCRIFGGDFMAMAIVFVATFVGFRLKQILLEDGVNVKFVFLICAFFSSVIATSGYIFGLGNRPEVALGTCVLYLIPGIPYINSISDLIAGEYLVSFSRFMDAIMLTFCLSVGLSVGILLMNLQLIS